MIAQWQIDQFHQQGFLVVEEVLSSADIAALQSDFDGWVEESRGHATVWGETLDGRPRFDIERDHAPDHPSLRRVASPTEISEAYRHTALNSRMATIAAPQPAPLPVTTLNTPSGMPAWVASSATRSRVSGVVSEGLMTIEQPAARAGMTFHMPIISGKFHGTMPATTPTGSFLVHAW